jgi:hypothetical protein
LKESLKHLATSFAKIENFFKGKILKNEGQMHNINPIENLNPINSDHNLIVNTVGSNGSDDGVSSQFENSNTTESGLPETYRLGQLSDFILNLNTGNLIPLTCGHNGLYCNSEMEMFSLYLLNSKFI